MTQSTLLSPQLPEDRIRWQTTRQRRRMLGSDWTEDLNRRLATHLSKTRIDQIGVPTSALNIFKSITVQTSILYDTAPYATSEEATEEQEDLMAGLLESMKWAPLLQRNNVYTVGFRESLIKVVETAEGVPLMTLVTPDTVVIETTEDPENIVRLYEAIIGVIDGETAGVWRVWDLTNPGDPRFYLLDKDMQDVTDKMPGELTWEVVEDATDEEPALMRPVYPCIDVDTGEPFIPFVKYRAAYTEDPWDAKGGQELIEGTLDISVLWSMFFAGARDASWPQKYGLDVEVQGASLQKSGGAVVASVETSNTSILMFKSPTVGGTPSKPSMGQFQPGADPKSFAEAVMLFQSVIVSNLGISPADLQQTQASESGIAIQLKRSAQRKTALAYLPSFEAADKQLLKLIARVYNMSAEPGEALPVDWSIHYTLPELTGDEVAQMVDRDIKLIKEGLASKVDTMLKLNPELQTRAAALQKLKDIAEENRQLG